MRRRSPSPPRSTSPATEVTDSAGTPWEGRRFTPNADSDDDGSAPERLVEAIRRFRSGEVGEAEVVAALRDSRLLVPLVADLGGVGRDEHGRTVKTSGAETSTVETSSAETSSAETSGAETSQELAIVTVVGRDGRTVLPAFTSVTAMTAWNPAARPVPASAVRVALAAAGEGTDLVVVDPTSATEFAIRRPALRAIGTATPWTPSYLDPAVLEAFMAAAAPEPAVTAVELAPGDPTARLAGPELVVRLTLTAGLDRVALDAVVGRLQDRWAVSPTIAERVDSLRVQLVSGD